MWGQSSRKTLPGYPIRSLTESCNLALTTGIEPASNCLKGSAPKPVQSASAKLAVTTEIESASSPVTGEHFTLSYVTKIGCVVGVEPNLGIMSPAS
jgi:hypothetical protein